MNAVSLELEGPAALATRDVAADLVRAWYSDGMVDRSVYRSADDLGVKCALALGDEVQDNAISHGMIAAWLRVEVGKLT